jgi:hypothetical protein
VWRSPHVGYRLSQLGTNRIFLTLQGRGCDEANTPAC